MPRPAPTPWLAAPVAAVLAAAWAIGGNAIGDPGPRATLLARSEALVHGVAFAGRVWSAGVLLAAAGIALACLLFALRARRTRSSGSALRGAARRWMATFVGLTGVATCALRGGGTWHSDTGVVRLAPVLVAAIAAVLFAHLAASARPADDARRDASRDLMATMCLGVLAVGLAAQWAALAPIGAVHATGERSESLPRLQDWLAATQHVHPGDVLRSALPYLLPVLVTLALLAPARGAWGGIGAMLPFLAAASVGFAGIGVSAEHALDAAGGLRARFGRPFADTLLPASLGDLESCGALVEADSVVFGTRRVSIGGVTAGPLPVAAEDCDALAWKLVERAHARPGREAAPFERYAWIGAEPDAPFGPVGCLVSSLRQIAEQSRAARGSARPPEGRPGWTPGEPHPDAMNYVGSWSVAPQLLWVGHDEDGGVLCHAQPLVSPAELHCEECEPERRLEVAIQPEKFVLIWKVANVVISVVDVPKGGDATRACGYPALLDRASSEWRAQGSHLSPAGRRRDLAVIRPQSDMLFSSAVGTAGTVACIDRPASGERDTEREPAFDVWLLPW